MLVAVVVTIVMCSSISRVTSELIVIQNGGGMRVTAFDQYQEYDWQVMRGMEDLNDAADYHVENRAAEHPLQSSGIHICTIGSHHVVVDFIPYDPHLYSYPLTIDGFPIASADLMRQDPQTYAIWFYKRVGDQGTKEDVVYRRVYLPIDDTDDNCGDRNWDDDGEF